MMSVTDEAGGPGSPVSLLKTPQPTVALAFLSPLLNSIEIVSLSVSFFNSDIPDCPVKVK